MADKERLEDPEICCWNCRNKGICALVHGLYTKDFKGILLQVAGREKATMFFEAVERVLAKVCDFYDPSK